MNNKKGLLLILVFFPLWLLGQEMKIKGNVKDDEGLGMLGVSVVVKGTTKGVATDNDGNFELKVNRNDVLVFSSVGYVTQEMKVGKNTHLKVVLYPDVEELVGIEKVAVAYGTADKKSFTGSMATVKAEEIQNKQTTDVAKALEGSVSGVQISTSTGQPGESSSIRIRGIGSINANSNPLIIVDGVPFAGSLSAINNNDIESVNVLKDAASSALYGARGANGVVIITTKSGARGKLSIQVDTRVGFNYRGIPEYDIVKSPAEYYETLWNALYNQNYFQARGGGDAAAAAAFASKSLIPNVGIGYNIYNVADDQVVGANGRINPQARIRFNDKDFNNWEKALFNTRARKEHNLSLTKGTEFNSFYFSLGYLGDEGYNLNSYFNRYTMRFSYKGEIAPWLKANTSSMLSHTQKQGTEKQNSYSNPFSWTRNIAPIYPVYKHDANGNPTGEYDFGESRKYNENTNPVATQNEDIDLYKDYYFNQALSLDMSIVEGLKFSTTGNFYGDFYNSNEYTTPIGGAGKTYNGSSTKYSTNDIVMTFNQLLKYSKDWDNYALEALLGHESYKKRLGTMSGTKNNFVDPSNSAFDNAAVTTGLSSYDRTYAVEGYFGQLNGNYKQKYFLSASLRRDASSVFAPENRWGTFWSVGGSWLLSNEKFLEKLSFINSLKLKASYGVQGNDYIYLPSTNSSRVRSYTPYMSLYSVSSDGKNPGLKALYKGNRNITWEESGNFNTGVEAALWDNRLTVEADFFYKKTNNLLFNMPVPASTGFTSEPRNVADMKNQGVEFSIGVTPVKTDRVTWSINFNGLHYKNTVTRLPEELREKGFTRGNQIMKEGGSIYDFYMVKWGGVNPDNGDAQYWIKNPATGQFELKQSADYESVNSLQYAGSAIPDLQGGFGTTLHFYNFDLALQFSYQLGGKFLDSQYMGLMHTGGNGRGWHTDIRNRWTPENRNTDVPRLQFNSQNIVATSDRFLIDASYLSLRNLSLGYNFGPEVTEKLKLSRLRYYITADNVYLWSKRQGLDPRASIGGTNTYAVYSPIRTVSMGLSVSF